MSNADKQLTPEEMRQAENLRTRVVDEFITNRLLAIVARSRKKVLFTPNLNSALIALLTLAVGAVGWGFQDWKQSVDKKQDATLAELAELSKEQAGFRREVSTALEGFDRRLIVNENVVSSIVAALGNILRLHREKHDRDLGRTTLMA